MATPSTNKGAAPDIWLWQYGCFFNRRHRMQELLKERRRASDKLSNLAKIAAATRIAIF
jgi:hypothetical protein